MDQKLKNFSLIAAACRNNGIGINGKLPWNLRKEMNYFTRITTTTDDNLGQNAVVMGRVTWESIPERYRPLGNRVNVVLSNTLSQVPKGVLLFKTLPECLKSLSQNDTISHIFIIGGERLYREGITMSQCHRIYLTRIDQHFECDTFFPQVDLNVFKPISLPQVPQEQQHESGINYKFFVYQRF